MRAAAWTLGLCTVAMLVGAAERAQCFSFPLNPGDRIVDIDLSSASQSFVYDGTLETISVAADVDRFLLSDGTSITLSPGQVTLSLTVSLVSGTLRISSAAFDSGDILGTYANASSGVADFTLTDQLDAGGPTLILSGDFDAPGMDLSITAFFGTVVSGALQGTYSVIPSQSDAGFLAAITPTGSMTVQFDNLLRSGVGLTGVCQIADTPCTPGTMPLLTPWPGLRDFDAQPEAILLTPDVPEPGGLSLLVLALGLTGIRARRPTLGGA